MHGEDPCPDCKPLCRYPGRRMRGASPATFFPRCYDLGDAGGRRAFEAAFRSAAAASLLRRLLADGCFSPTGDLLCCAPVPVNSDLEQVVMLHSGGTHHASHTTTCVSSLTQHSLPAPYTFTSHGL